MRCVVFSPDGQYLASGSCDNTAKLWSIDRDQEIVTYTGHQREVWSIAFSPDGKYLVTGSYDYSVRLWSVMSRQDIRIFVGHQGPVWCVAFSPDGKFLASGGSLDSALKLWSIEGKEIATYHLPGSVASVAFRPDGKYLICGSMGFFIKGEIGFKENDNVLKCWSLNGHINTEIAHVGHQGGVYSLAVSSDGNYLVSGGEDNKIILWSVETGNALNTYPGNKNSNHVSFSRDILISGGYDGVLKFWKVESRKTQNAIRAHTEPIWSVAVSVNYKFVATGSEDKTIKIWSTDSGTLVSTFRGHQEKINCITFDYDEKHVISGSWDNVLKLWLIGQNEAIRTYTGHQGHVTSVAFNPDNKHFISGSWDSTIKLWSIAEEKEIKTYQGHQGPITSVVFEPHGKYFVSGGWDNTLKLWSIVTSNFIKSISTDSRIFAISNWLETGLGSCLATGHQDNRVCCWKLGPNNEICLLWSSRQSILNASHLNLESSVGFTVPDAKLLEQKGAVGKPLLFSSRPDEIALKLRKDTANRNIMADPSYIGLVKKAIILKSHLSRDDDGNTALHLAILNNQAEKMIILLREIERFDRDCAHLFEIRNNEGKTALDICEEIQTKPPERVLELIKKATKHRTQIVGHLDSEITRNDRFRFGSRK